MGSQNSSPSLPRQVSDAGGRDSRPAVTEKFESVNKKASAGNVGRIATEMPEEQNEKAHASKPPTDHRSTFFGLPIEIRNAIYSLVLTVEDSYSYGVSHGMICLADEPGYPPKLCDIDYMHTIDHTHTGHEYSEVYLTEDYEPLKPFISRKAEAWRIEINQLKYVCKQLHHETRGITLKINAGTKLVFHGTRTRSGSSGMANSIFHNTGRVSGMANFVDFYSKCSPEQQEHIRNVDIIELPLDDEQPRNPEMPDVVDSRTRVEHLMAFKLGKAFRPRPLSRFKIEKRSFRRRCAELTGTGHAASRNLFKICQQNPSLRVIVRYNELQDTVGLEWIKRMCTYHMALCREKESIAMRDEEKVILRELILSYGGAATKPSLENLRMSSSLNFGHCSNHPRYHFIDIPTIKVALAGFKQRKEEIDILFQKGV